MSDSPGVTIVRVWATKVKLPAISLVCDNKFSQHYCGYVGVAAHHPWYGILDTYATPGAEDLDVHGGVTYCGDMEHVRKFHPDLPVEHWWFGFDCAHAGDKLIYTPAAKAAGLGISFPGDVLRDNAFVMRQCEYLARQLVHAYDTAPHLPDDFVERQRLEREEQERVWRDLHARKAAMDNDTEPDVAQPPTELPEGMTPAEWLMGRMEDSDDPDDNDEPTQKE
jgi:hypothetical protein